MIGASLPSWRSTSGFVVTTSRSLRQSRRPVLRLVCITFSAQATNSSFERSRFNRVNQQSKYVRPLLYLGELFPIDVEYSRLLPRPTGGLSLRRRISTMRHHYQKYVDKSLGAAL